MTGVRWCCLCDRVRGGVWLVAGEGWCMTRLGNKVGVLYGDSGKKKFCVAG